MKIELSEQLSLDLALRRQRCGVVSEVAEVFNVLELSFAGIDVGRPFLEREAGGAEHCRLDVDPP